jgi:hypothetical protein
MWSQPGYVDKFPAIDFVQPDEVSVGKMRQDRGDVLRRLHLRERLHETEKPAQAGLHVAEVVAAQQQANEYKTLGVVAKVEPAVGVEQLVTDYAVRHGATPNKRATMTCFLSQSLHGQRVILEQR